MKTKFLLLATFCMITVAAKAQFSIGVCIATMAFATTNSDKPVSHEQLPQTIKTFLTTHFSEEKMVRADKDWDGYDVVLTNGTELEFTSKGQWTEIQMRKEAVPESVLKLLPETLVSYIKQTYPEKNIKKIENKSYGYEIELLGMRDFELKFDKKGKFLRIDD